jgi:hypothetical protein
MMGLRPNVVELGCAKCLNKRSITVHLIHYKYKYYRVPATLFLVGHVLRLLPL